MWEGLAENRSTLEMPSATLRVEVTVNGQQFTTDGIAFLEHPEPVISSLAPSGGPTAGGTALRVQGYRLGNASGFLCRFGTSRVVVPARIEYASSTLHCATPRHSECEPDAAVGLVDVAVGLNGQQYSEPFAYEYAPVSSISQISPSAGPQAGGILVHVTGDNLRPAHPVSGSSLPALTCRFGETTVPASWANVTDLVGISCMSPMRTPGAVALEVTSNGQDFTDSSVVWVQYVEPALSSLQPPAGPEGGGALLTICGTRLNPSPGPGPDPDPDPDPDPGPETLRP